MSDTPRTDAEYQQWETLEEAARFSQELERENAVLRADKERLDWLSSQKDQPWLYWERPLRLTREAIDAFRKEAQP